MGRKYLDVDREEPESVEISRKKRKKNKRKGKSNDEYAVSREEGKPAVSAESGSNKRRKKERNGLGQKWKGTGNSELVADRAEEDPAAAAECASNRKRNNEGNGSDQSVPADSENGMEKGVVVSGDGVEDAKYAALRSFDESKLPGIVLECCKGFNKPSPIQARAWPFLLDGRDLVGIAATGSGKTLAFGVPGLMHILQRKESQLSGKSIPRCLVLSPTRELAQQIADVLHDAGKPCGVKTVCLYGGISKGPQIAALKSGIDMIIGTPGRLKDLIQMGFCNLKDVTFVVLDEADRMLDMGFEPEVRAILNQTCNVRQTVMLSATWPLSVHQLAQEFMDPNPVKVVVGSKDLAANHDVMQIVEVLEVSQRDRRLVSLLEKYHMPQKNRVLIFVLYKKDAPRVELVLQRRGWNTVSVHGDKSQYERTEALSLFKDGKCPLMIATDVAARGLDIPDVEVVINYSYPLTTEDYVHRIGRTGRAGKKGVAHTFFTQDNKKLAGELVNVLREAGQIVPSALMKFGTHVKKRESKLYGAHFKELTADAPKSTKITFNDSDAD